MKIDVTFSEYMEMKLGVNEARVQLTPNDKRNIKNLIIILKDYNNGKSDNPKFFKVTKNELIGQSTDSARFSKEYILKTDSGDVTVSVDKDFSDEPLIKVNGTQNTFPKMVELFKKYDYCDEKIAQKEIKAINDKEEKFLKSLAKKYNLKDFELRLGFEDPFEGYSYIRSTVEINDEDVKVINDMREVVTAVAISKNGKYILKLKLK